MVLPHNRLLGMFTPGSLTRKVNTQFLRVLYAKLILIVLLVGLVAPRIQAQTVLYSQPWDSSTDDHIGNYLNYHYYGYDPYNPDGPYNNNPDIPGYPNFDDGTYGYRTYDNFLLNSTSSIATVSWYVTYFDTDNYNYAYNTDTWDIQFYSDSNGKPGSSLYSTQISGINVQKLLVASDDYNGDTYLITANLTKLFVANSNTVYWFSPLSEGSDYRYYGYNLAGEYTLSTEWNCGNNGTLGSYQNFIGYSTDVTSNLTAISLDRAFTLYGVPGPTLTLLSPSSVPAGSAATVLTVSGTGFTSDAKIYFNGTALTTTFVSATSLKATIPANLLVTVGSFPVTVQESAGTSNAVTFSVTQPVPVLTSITPNSAVQGSAAVTITLNGNYFTSDAKVWFATATVPVTFVSATKLTAVVPATSLTTIGTYAVKVQQTSGTSVNQLPFNVTAPLPTLTVISPTFATVGSAAFTLTVSGANFTKDAKVTFNNTVLTTTYLTATTLTATVPATSLTTVGTFAVKVAQASGTSNGVNFTVKGLLPVVSSLSPSTAQVGADPVSVIVNGSNFTTDAKVYFNNTLLTTTYNATNKLTATLPTSLLGTAGAFPVFVRQTSGDSIQVVKFTVVATLPTITTISPASAKKDSPAVTLTVTGTSFTRDASINFNTTALATTYVSPTQLTAVIPANLLATMGTFPIKVAQKSGTSTSVVNFSVTNPTPTLTSVSPARATVGSQALVISVTGTYFTSDAKVKFNNTVLVTTFVSATTLTATIPASSLTTAGNFPVVVSQASGTSDPLGFAVRGVRPTLTSVTPGSAIAGSPAVTITLTGTSFSSEAKVYFNGTGLVTTFKSATSLTAVVPATLLTTPGSASILVRQTSGATSPIGFLITSADPTLTSITPNRVKVGSAALVATLTGTGFTADATVSFNGTTLTPTAKSATSLTVTIPANLLTVAGLYTVYVTQSNGDTDPIVFSVNP